MSQYFHTTGFVYVLTNDSMPDMVKVGLTKKPPEDREKNLFNTSTPTEFNVVYRVVTSHPKEVEAQAHKLLDQYRVNSRREFFKISIEKAITAVESALVQKSGIHSWISQKPHQLKNGDRIALTLEEGQIFAVISYKTFNSIMSNQPEIIDLWQAQTTGDYLELYLTDSPKHIAGLSTYDDDYITDPVPYLNRQHTAQNLIMNGKERLLSGERLVWIPKPNSQQSGVIFEISDYCQVIGRTWIPKINYDGIPLLINDFSYTNIWPEAYSIISEALNLHIPNKWGSREELNDLVGKQPQVPEYWLPQLKK
jgi:hypothetical protein